MNVTLEAIKFNHDPNSATYDAFNIRRNETAAVIRPEWRRGISVTAEDSPAAYARSAVRDQIITIQARITWSDLETKSVWIRAVDGNLYPNRSGTTGFCRFAIALLRPFLRRTLETNVLGSVTPKQVKPCMGTDEFRTFELRDVRLEEAGVGVNDIVWLWQFSHDGANWTDIVTTRHRIYTVRHLPKGSWKPNSNDQSDTQLPWTEVLEYACRWGAGAESLPSIATKVTTALNALGPDVIHYDDTTKGSPHYTRDLPRRFDCRRFLDLLKGESQDILDRNVNCNDCAAMTSSFVTILGYALPVSSMSSKNSTTFPLRRHQRIGQSWQDQGEFIHHTVAWNGGPSDEVSDACVMLDESESGLGKPDPLLAGNLRFSGERSYRHFLVRSDQEPNCVLTEGSTFFRRNGLRFTEAEITEPILHLETIKRLYDFDKWGVLRIQPVWDLSAFLTERIDFEGWVVRSARLIPRDSLELFVSRQEASHETVVRLDVQAAKDSADTVTHLLRVLGGFELPGVKFRKDMGFGELTFADDSGFVIVFSRFSLVVLIRNVAGLPEELGGFAQLVDKFLVDLRKEHERAESRGASG